MIERSVLLLLLVVVTGACGGRRPVAEPGDEDAGAVGEPEPDAAAADAAVVTDAPSAERATSDAGSDPPQVEPSTGGWRRYVEALDQRFDRWSERIAECFNGSKEVLAARREPVDADPELSVELGQITIDEAAARACLAALGSATCDELARTAAGNDVSWAFGSLEPCGRIILRRVPVGGRCRHDEACPSLQCQSHTEACGNAGVCAAPSTPAASGETCMGRPCASGTFCAPGEDVCRPLGREGAPCYSEEQCVPGYHCQRRDASAQGRCQPVERGAPCTASVECAPVFSCVRATAGAMGTCQAGKRAGEPCTPEGRSLGGGRPLSDCGYLLECADLDGRGARCHAGVRLGERCGAIAGPGAYLYCLEGFCDIPQFGSMGVCRPRQSSGPCTRDDACIPPAECRAWSGPSSPASCQVPPWRRPPGAACTTNGSELDCGVLGYCRATTRPLDPEAVVPGVCEPRKKAGESCVAGWDQCEPFTTCTNGTCTKC